MTAALLLVVLAVLLGITIERLRAGWERARINRRSNAEAAGRVVLLQAGPRPRLPITVRRDGDAA